MINPLGTGKLVIFQVSYDRDWHGFELVPFTALGIFGGLFGALFIKVLSFLSKRKSRRPIMQVCIVSVVTSAVFYVTPFAKTSNSQLVADLFQESNVRLEWDKLLLCMVVKSVFLTVSVLVPSGLFIPVMTIGACFGRIVGESVLYITQHYNHSLFNVCDDQCVIPGVYAMVGAAAALCGVTRMTVSLVVIMFELTGALSYALPIMTSIMVSKWIADAISPDSLFDYLIKRNAYPYLNHKKEYVHTTALRDLLSTSPTLDIDHPYPIHELEDALHALSESDAGFPLLDGQLLVGYIQATELEHALETAKDHHAYPCFFKRVGTKRGPGRDSWSPLGASVFEATEDSFEPNDFTKWTDQAPLCVGVVCLF